MSDIVILTVSGRLTNEPKTREYGSEGKTLTSFNVASTVGFGDNKKTLFTNCTAFGKSGEAIAKYLNKGDGITVTGEPTQNKKDDKVYHGLTVSNWTFGPKKQGSSNTGGNDEPPRSEEDNPFSDDDIPY